MWAPHADTHWDWVRWPGLGLPLPAVVSSARCPCVYQGEKGCVCALSVSRVHECMYTYVSCVYCVCGAHVLCVHSAQMWMVHMCGAYVYMVPVCMACVYGMCMVQTHSVLCVERVYMAHTHVVRICVACAHGVCMYNAHM